MAHIAAPSTIIILVLQIHWLKVPQFEALQRTFCVHLLLSISSLSINISCYCYYRLSKPQASFFNIGNFQFMLARRLIGRKLVHRLLRETMLICMQARKVLKYVWKTLCHFSIHNCSKQYSKWPRHVKHFFSFRL